MIEITNLIKSYSNRVVLNIPTLKLEDNKLYGIVGHNGAGKTTLFKCMTNVICNYKGQIIFNDKDVKLNAYVLTKVGLVLDGMSVYVNRSGMFNIKYFSGLRDEYNEKLVQKLIKDLSLDKVINQKVSTYSYGMRKKLILLIALINSPSLLILDEPFRGLDIETVQFFKDYLKQLQNQGLTLLISSHVLSDIEDICDEVIVIKKGFIDNHLNLNELKNQELRTLNTNNNTRVCDILSAEGISFEMVDGLIKFAMNDDNWDNVYNILFNEKIQILEMNKVQILDEKVVRGGR
ncbi:MAG: ATP-binding cassette domain-containing protein [Bacilli bacterium]